MHGLINKAIQSFLCDSFGTPVWHDIAQASGVMQFLGPDGFEAMQLYDDALTDAVLDQVAAMIHLNKDSAG